MHSSFSDQFNFHAWQGARAKQFLAANDAFQQLIGDGLRASFGAAAWVATTAGRDGGIDAWVDGVSSWPQGFPSLANRFIVECKWHDAAAKDPVGNIDQEWRRVSAKLTEQAASGWPNTYAPWKKASGYLYCISLRFPHQQARESLRDSIRSFFDNLPPKQRPPIAREAIHVWDWADIAAWLRSYQRLADLWPGLVAGDLVDHASFRARLAQRDAEMRIGFRGYLLDDNLPFVPPPDDDPCHPDRLFARLQKNENLLLLGEGGIGKTRTAFEVAERADKAGWRVLHLDPPDIGIDPRNLLAELALPGDTLVVVDYIDKIQNFDARYWRETLLPEVSRRGGRLRLIANARPADSQRHLQAITNSSLFASIPLKASPERRRAVAEAIEATLCPRALSAFGRQRVAELCGNRPIIAMFIARELESLALAGQLPGALDNAPRPGELMGWLSRRLGSAELLHQPAGSCWDTAPPQPGLCAAVAALASAPMAETELIQVAAATLSAGGGNPVQAARCIDLLRRGGWLELDAKGLELRTPHDVVADETLARLLSVEPAVLPWLLAAAPLGRPLGRFALALGRLAGNQLLAENTADEVASWLASNATLLGTALVVIPSNVSAYALGAVFDCPYWAEPATVSWAALVEPFLNAYGTKIEARHLLHRGLDMPGVPAELRDVALAWLSRHGTAEVGGFVLAPLLTWDISRLGDTAQATVLQRALAWLNEYGNAEAAGFVLPPLLTWNADRLGDTAQATVLERALAWLNEYGNTEAGRFVLNPLLAWDTDRLGDTAQATVLQRALAWLNEYGNTEAAGFVLAPLLAWDTDRLGDTAQATVLQRALAWLNDYGNTEAAQFVLHPLLAWDAGRLGDAAQATVLQRALAWLNHYGDIEAAGFVLPPLLAWDARRLGDAAQATVLQRALAWFTEYGNTEAARFVLAPLLAWDTDRLGNTAEATALQQALAWLNEYGNTEAAGFVLAPLLAWDTDRLGDTAQTTVLQRALAWLTEYGNTEAAGFVLAPLLAWDTARLNGKPELALAPAVAWLTQFHRSNQADFILAGLLSHKQLSDEARRQCAAWAAEWLRARVDNDQSTHLLRVLLQTVNRYTDAVDANAVIVLAGRWLDLHPNHAERLFVMARLLRLRHLPDNAWLKVAIRAMEEIGRRAGVANDDYLLSSVVNRLGGLRHEHQQLWLRLSKRWITAHGDAKAVRQFMWGGQINSSPVVDGYFDLLRQECVRRFGPSFSV